MVVGTAIPAMLWMFLSFVCHFRSDFQASVLAEAHRRSMGVIALKGMARQQWPDPDQRKRYPKCWYQPNDAPEIVRLAMAWTLSQPITAMLTPGDERLFRLALRVLPDLPKMDAAALARLRSLASELTRFFRRRPETAPAAAGLRRERAQLVRILVIVSKTGRGWVETPGGFHHEEHEEHEGWDSMNWAGFARIQELNDWIV